MDILQKLSAPFAPERVSWRVGSTTSDKSKGMALAYVDARDVMERLDEVMGPAGWQNDYPHAGSKTVCRIGLKIDGEWIWKSNGAGDSDIEAAKGALSDSFKRAAVCWGIGRYLYDIESPWVDIEKRGNSYVIKKSEYARLQAILPVAIHNETDDVSHEVDPKELKSLEKADKVIIRALEVLQPLDAFERANKLMEDKDMVAVLRWVKSNYPEKFKVIQKLEVDV